MALTLDRRKDRKRERQTERERESETERQTKRQLERKINYREEAGTEELPLGQDLQHLGLGDARVHILHLR